MKFLGKSTTSKVLSKGLTYKRNNNPNNIILKEILTKEQNNFCAYTEIYFKNLDNVEVEHFNSAIKYSDDYYNYYAVIRRANQYKKDREFKNAAFFTTLFFQNDENFKERIRYVKGGEYEEVDLSDKEAKDLIEFLGFNHPNLYEDRKNRIRRLRNTFIDADYNKEKQLEYFKEHREELSFITAIEIELNLDLSEFYT